MAGGLTILLIPYFINPIQQGYYYTFLSIIGIQIFFELGFGNVLLQLGSHASAHIKDPNSKLSKVDKNIKYILNLISVSNKWYTIISILFFIIVSAGGIAFFVDYGSLKISEWLTSWLILMTATSLNLKLSSKLVIHESFGEVSAVAKLRLKQSILGYLILWFLLIVGADLFSVVAIPVAGSIMTMWWVYRNGLEGRLKSKLINNDIDGDKVSYKKDIFPLHWRIAISWISGYFIFNFLVPVVFANQGEIEAGRLGLATTVFLSLATLGMSWITAKTPTFAMHIALNQRVELNSLFIKLVSRCIYVNISLSIIFMAALQFVGFYYPEITNRFPPLLGMIIMAIANLANTLIFSMAAYIRAHKVEPLLSNSVFTAFGVVLAVLIFVDSGLIFTIAAYSFVIIFLSLPWCLFVFIRFWRMAK